MSHTPGQQPRQPSQPQQQPRQQRMTHEDYEAACRERGICSAPDCPRPIDGWCRVHTSGTKFCLLHLLEHTLRQPRPDACRFHMIVPPPTGATPAPPAAAPRERSGDR